MEYTKKVDGTELEVEYLYHKGEEAVWTDPNGDPGTPGYPAVVEILAVFATLKDKNNNDIETIEEEILESYG